MHANQPEHGMPPPLKRNATNHAQVPPFLMASLIIQIDPVAKDNTTSFPGVIYPLKCHVAG